MIDRFERIGTSQYRYPQRDQLLDVKALSVTLVPQTCVRNIHYLMLCHALGLNRHILAHRLIFEFFYHEKRKILFSV